MDSSRASFDPWLQNTLLKPAVCNLSSRPVQLHCLSDSTNIHLQSSLTSISHALLFIPIDCWGNRLYSLHDSRSKSKWCLSSHLRSSLHPSTSIALPAPPSVSGNQPPLGRSAPRTTSPYLRLDQYPSCYRKQSIISHSQCSLHFLHTRLHHVHFLVDFLSR